MMILLHALGSLYKLLLCLYPRHFRDEFAWEMQVVYGEMVEQARQQGTSTLIGVLLREWLDAPLTLVRAHWHGWQKRGKAMSHFLVPCSSLPSPDGRTSWMQAGLEVSLFLSLGAFLVVLTYLPLARTTPGPPRGPGDGSAITLLLPLPLFLAGLARGLPRWAYPSGGMLLGYTLLAAIRTHRLPFLAASLLAFAALAAVAAVIHARVRPLPAGLRRVGQSVVQDETRLSFCVYGAMPLTIATAFDNAYLNNRTPYLALAVLLMVAGAFVYVRSRRSAVQMIALLGAMSLCFTCALLDHVHLIGRMGSWIAEIGWLIQQWACVTALMLAPFLIGLARRGAHHNREVSRR